MAITPEQPQVSPNAPRVRGPLIKAALVASLVFSGAWVRWPLSKSPPNLIGIFLWSGIFLALISCLIGTPIARYLLKFKVQRWWIYLLAGIATGALFAAVFSSRPTISGLDAGPDVPIENPRAITFSPWTRNEIIGAPVWADYYGSVAFGAVVGGVLGFFFWYFYSRRTGKELRY